jgi:hypothetical protein
MARSTRQSDATRSNDDAMITRKYNATIAAHTMPTRSRNRRLPAARQTPVEGASAPGRGSIAATSL